MGEIQIDARRPSHFCHPLLGVTTGFSAAEYRDAPSEEHRRNHHYQWSPDRESKWTDEVEWACAATRSRHLKQYGMCLDGKGQHYADYEVQDSQDLSQPNSALL